MLIAYLDCFSGISGDMLLGALFDAGADVSHVERSLQSLDVEPISLRLRRVRKQGLTATDVEVACATSHIHRNLADIRQLLQDAGLPPRVTSLALQAFEAMADAEAKIHGLPREAIHFHEIGALDSIADIVGCLLALEQLGVTRVEASPLPLSAGRLTIAHGSYPLPAPATMELLRGIPCYGVDADMELVTPTGAALLRVLASRFGPMPHLVPLAIGYGAGKASREGIPNVVRVVLGHAAALPVGIEQDSVTVLEAQVDDMLPEHFSRLSELLAESEALDYFFTPVQMKKGRPGTLVTVLAPCASTSALTSLLLSHTSTLGVRHSMCTRSVLPRRVVTVATPWGAVRVKVGLAPGRAPKLAPEYEDCRSLSAQWGIPIDIVYREACRAATEVT